MASLGGLPPNAAPNGCGASPYPEARGVGSRVVGALGMHYPNKQSTRLFTTYSSAIELPAHLGAHTLGVVSIASYMLNRQGGTESERRMRLPEGGKRGRAHEP